MFQIQKHEWTCIEIVWKQINKINKINKHSLKHEKEKWISFGNKNGRNKAFCKKGYRKTRCKERKMYVLHVFEIKEWMEGNNAYEIKGSCLKNKTKMVHGVDWR